MNIKELIEGVSTEIQAAKADLAKRGISVEIGDIEVSMVQLWDGGITTPSDHVQRFTIKNLQPVDPKAN